MFNSLKSLKALRNAEPRSARTKAKAPAQDNLSRAAAKIAALKAEIEACQVEARAMAQLQSEEQAKAERLRQAGADLLRIHKDLQTARAKTSAAEAGVRAAAAATQAADLELHTILQSLEAPAKAPTPVAKPVKLAAPAPIAVVLPAPATPVAAPSTTVGSPEAEPYLVNPDINPFTD
jgi:hypothetical protein